MSHARQLVPGRVKRAVKVLIGREDAGGEPPGQLAAPAQQYWSASDVPDDKRDLSHWKGEGRWADESYRIAEFWHVAADSGFQPLAVALRPATNYAFYVLSKS